MPETHLRIAGTELCLPLSHLLLCASTWELRRLFVGRLGEEISSHCCLTILTVQQSWVIFVMFFVS